MSSFTAQLVGGPTAVLEYAGLRWLTDPSLSPPGTYEGGLVKTTGPAVTIEQLEPIDVVLLSHEHHSDNLDPDGRAFLPRAGRVLTTTQGAEAWAATPPGSSRGARSRSRGPTAGASPSPPCRHSTVPTAAIRSWAR